MIKSLVLSFIFIQISVFALPVGVDLPLHTQVDAKSYLYDQAFESSSYDFNAIVKLSNCSGALVRFHGQPKNSYAYVLTNGHCLGGRFLRPGEVKVNERSRRRMGVFDSNMRQTRISATTLVYATMTYTDSALYRLDKTYEFFEKKGITALMMSSERPFLNTQIEIISGYWERGYRCSIEAFIPKLLEADWTFEDSIRYSEPGCDTIGGTSGSPVIDALTREVIAVNNTGNESGGRCTMNNPCEVDENGQRTVIEGASYAQQTYLFYSCLTLDFDIDLNKEGCLLPQ